MKQAQMVLNHLDKTILETTEQKTKVVRCPECNRDYCKDYEVAYIMDFGMCITCDKIYTDVQQELRADAEEMGERCCEEIEYAGF